MVILVMEDELHSLFQIIGKQSDVLLFNFDLFEDWLLHQSSLITGFIIGKYLDTEFEFTENIPNEELFERLLVLRDKGE